MDLKQFFIELNDNRSEYDRILRLALEWRGRTLRYYPKPTIAMIHGYCFGGAFSIVEGCDLAIAAEDTTFGLSEINFGMFPGGTVSKSMANLMGPRDALWYGMLGRTFDGKTAQQMKFINLAVPAADLEKETMKVAAELVTKDPIALRCVKEAYRHSLEMPWEAAMGLSSAKESEVAYLQKRCLEKNRHRRLPERQVQARLGGPGAGKDS